MATSGEMAQIFSQMAETFDPSKAEGVNATFQFDLSGDNGGQYWGQTVKWVSRKR